MAPDEPARCELHLPHPRDRERDGDVDLLLACLCHSDPQDASAGAGGRGRLRSGRWRGWERGRRMALPLIDVAKRAEQAIRLLDVDLAVGEELQDLLALVAAHLAASVRVIERGGGVVDAKLAAGKT